MNTTPQISIIIPARNEQAQIVATLHAAFEAIAHFEQTTAAHLHLESARCELIVVDNMSTDATRERLLPFEAQGAQVIACSRLKAPCARNAGTAAACGTILVYLDADTHIPRTGLARIEHHVRIGGYGAGIFAYAPQERGIRAQLWWFFWNQVRRLPLANAKAMPAFMFCTREVFERLGPFDEDVVLGEEWPILAGLYRADRRRLIYDRTLTARSSSRRMELLPFGYVRCYAKYLWAILHRSGRRVYPDTIREP